MSNVADSIWQGRLDVMRDALDLAMASPHVDHSKTTLKIFVAPEFFFRGPHGAYKKYFEDHLSERQHVQGQGNTK